MKLVLLFIILIAIILFSYIFICGLLYYIVFHTNKRKTLNPYVLPKGKQYKEVSSVLLKMIDDNLKTPYRDVCIRSFDGLLLHAKYYEVKKGNPIQLSFHGYKSNSNRDFSGGINYILDKGINMLLVDQRGHGRSEGSFLSLGIKERYDVESWVNYINNAFNCPSIIITGISMGASTIMLSNSLIQKYSNIKCLILDSGYSSPKEIVKSEIKKKKIPEGLFYSLINTGCKLFGKFNLNDFSCLDEMKHNSIPTIFIHGNKDLFVPLYMENQLFKSAICYKEEIIGRNAGHGLSFVVDNEKYVSIMNVFLSRWLSID